MLIYQKNEQTKNPYKKRELLLSMECFLAQSREEALHQLEEYQRRYHISTRDFIKLYTQKDTHQKCKALIPDALDWALAYEQFTLFSGNLNELNPL